MSNTVNFICTKQRGRVSGGYIYNKHLLEGLQKSGYQIKSYCAETIADMTTAKHIIIDSIAVNECAPFLLDLTCQPILLCHLPPEMQVVQSDDIAHEQENPVKQLITSSFIVTTGTSCTDYMQSQYALKSSQMDTVMPGLVDDWQAKQTHSKLPKQLLVVANLLPNKGYEMLIAALAELTHLDWHLQIFGDNRFAPDYANEVLTSIKTNNLHNRVSYQGVIDQDTLNAQMINSDLLIQLSPYEPYSMVSLEAIHSNLPMLSAASGEQAEFGRSGLVHYLSEYTVKNCVQSLHMLLTDESEYANLCQKPILRRRTWAQVSNEFKQLLESR